MLIISSNEELRRILGDDHQWVAGEERAPKKRRRKGAKTPAQKTLSKEEREALQRRFAGCWRQLGGPQLVTEHRFHPTRRYRLDFALPEALIGIEVDGGTWSDGRTGHNWGTGITRDHEKQNLAVLMGWRIFRFTTDMLSEAKVAQSLTPVIEFAKRELEGAS